MKINSSKTNGPIAWFPTSLWTLATKGLGFLMSSQHSSKSFQNNPTVVPTQSAAGQKTGPSPPSKPVCIRINAIPEDWTEHDIRGALQNEVDNFDTQKPKLSLFPACSGRSQTALLNLGAPSGFFLELKGEKHLELRTAEKDDFVSIDNNFSDLTPLNDPGNEIFAEFVELHPRELIKILIILSK
jgi:hypothetical protein